MDSPGPSNCLEPDRSHDRNGFTVPVKRVSAEKTARFAIIQLPSDMDMAASYQALLEAGFTSVTFHNSVLDHADVKKELEKYKKEVTRGGDGSVPNGEAPMSDASPSPVAEASAVGTEARSEANQDGFTETLPRASTSPSGDDEVQLVSSPVAATSSTEGTSGSRKTFSTFRDRIKARMDLKNDDNEVFALPIVKGVPLVANKARGLEREVKPEVKEEVPDELPPHQRALASRPTSQHHGGGPMSVAAVTKRPYPFGAAEAGPPMVKRYVIKSRAGLQQQAASQLGAPRLMDQRLERPLPQNHQGRHQMPQMSSPGGASQIVYRHAPIAYRTAPPRIISQPQQPQRVLMQPPTLAQRSPMPALAQRRVSSPSVQQHTLQQPQAEKKPPVDSPLTMHQNSIHQQSTIIKRREDLPPDQRTPIPQRTPAVVYRKDYKNPPLPLPADDGTHVKCHLCENKIMASRLSNLTNHVRRHSATKQYQCIHCNYQHNEQAKVRLHMTNNHQDTTSVPKDNLNKEMQKMWRLLMEECFPGYLDQLNVNDPQNCIEWEKQGVVSKRLDYGTATLDELHSCTDCGNAVALDGAVVGSARVDPLLDHIRTDHMDECTAFSCQDCGYMNAEEWKVRWHISNRHKEREAEVGVTEEPAGSHMDIFLYKFFPSIEKVLGKRQDKEEAAINEALETEKKTIKVEAKMPIVREPVEEEAFVSDVSRCVNSPELSESAFFDEPKVDKSLLGPDVVLCELCNKILDFSNKNSLCSLLAHAKRHFRVKQFECTQCAYASSEAAHVRTHMLTKHDTQERPREHNNEVMQTSWLKVMKQCFPDLTDRIDAFKFKSGKSYVPETDEQHSTHNPPVHNYSTRRKRNFFG